MGSSTSKEIATQVGRKVKKPFTYYRPNERAEKELKRQQTVASRAPMNVGAVKLDPDIKNKRLEEFTKLQKKDDDYLKRMTKIRVLSTDPEGFVPVPDNMHSHIETSTREKPEKQLYRESLDAKSPPLKGTTTIDNIVDALVHHKEDPKEWTAAELSKQINIREKDMENVLKYYDLLDTKSVFRLEERGKKEVHGNIFEVDDNKSIDSK